MSVRLRLNQRFLGRASSQSRGIELPELRQRDDVANFLDAVNIVCPGCASVLDATDPRPKILQEASQKQHPTLLIPLGTRASGKVQPTKS